MTTMRRARRFLMTVQKGTLRLPWPIIAHLSVKLIRGLLKLMNDKAVRRARRFLMTVQKGTLRLPWPIIASSSVKRIRGP